MLNKLYTMANQDPALKDKLKFMGVGKDNDANAMKMWQVFHKVPFPMIADPDGTFAKALNFANYPVTMVLDKSGKIMWVHVGAFDNAEEALKGIKAVVK